MTATVQAVVEALGPIGLEVARAWPRTPEHLLLHLRRPSGESVAGQWFAHPARAAHVAERTQAASPLVRAGVCQVAGSGVVLQEAGADRRLPALARELRRGGAALVTHRPERRAVVRHDDPVAGTVFTKVVRPRHVPRPGPSCSQLHALRVPEVLEVDHEAGRVTTRALPGSTLHDLLADVEVSATELARYGRACGVALAELHARTVVRDEPDHGIEQEIAVTDRWLAAADAHRALPTRVLRRLARRRDRAVAAAPPSRSRPVVLHRDLHDQQLLVRVPDGAGPLEVGLLDFDLAAVGDPALDLANLLVHLELRVVQGLTPQVRAQACAAGLLDGYEPSDQVLGSVPQHAELARLRLVALYAFRPAYRDAVVDLLGRDDPYRPDGR